MAIRNSGGAGGQKRPRKGKGRENLRLSDFVAALLPDGAVIQFVICEDFDNDGQDEAAVGFSRFSPLPPDSAVLVIKRKSGGIEHDWLHFTSDSCLPEQAGIIDDASAADTDGDGCPELIVSRVIGHDHDIDVYVFDWTENGMRQVWHSGRTFFHGSMEVEDADGDGTAEIVVESGTNEGSEVIALKDACYRVRESRIFKWDGRSFVPAPFPVRMPYAGFNKAVEFLKAIWMRDYGHAYRMAEMPGFLGLDGLDDSSLKTFKSHVDRKILPVLARNLSRGKLVPAEPYDTCCRFVGAEDSFTVELVQKENSLMIYGITITRRL